MVPPAGSGSTGATELVSGAAQPARRSGFREMSPAPTASSRTPSEVSDGAAILADAAQTPRPAHFCPLRNSRGATHLIG